MEATSAAHSLAFYLTHAELVSSTSQQSSAYARTECVVPRTYVGGTPSPWGAAIIVPLTVAPEAATLVINGKQPEDRQLAELRDLTELPPNWDGEGAAAPNRKAVREAMNFVIAAGSAGASLEPTLHADGSVLLEVPAGGALQFSGSGQIDFAVIGKGRGRAMFDGTAVPDVVRQVLG